jgi:ABC-type dipeptide/oligopeptide/nickel transport system permease subunit
MIYGRDELPKGGMMAVPRRGRRGPDPDLGLILADSRSFISRAWWLGVFPGVFIMITVLSINFLGDALRDLLDVREAKDLAHA